MKKIILLSAFITSTQLLTAQTYPDPEFVNEVYALRKDSNTLIRLEKDFSKMNYNTKMGGMGGVQYGYSIESEKSPVRLNGSTRYSFVYSTGAANSNPAADSVMRSNGMDPSMYSNMGMDPTKMISLYSMESSKGKRNIVMAAGAGVNLLKKSKKESNKYPFSVKKVREGYYEFIVDKILPKGEYAFLIMSQGGMDNSYPLFAFAIE